EKIPRTAATSGKADRTMGVALHRLANVYAQMGKTKEQSEALQESLPIFHRQMKEHPEVDWAKFDATLCYDDLGEIWREIEPDPARLFELYQNSLKLKEELVERVQSPEPTPFNRRFAVAASYLKLGAYAMEVGEPARVREYAEKGLRATEAAMAIDK